MKIIDRNTGKRVMESGKGENNDLKKTDPITRLVEKGIEAETETSPMDPPEAYDENYTVSDVDTKNFQQNLQSLINEHKEVTVELEKFESSLISFREGGFQMTQEISDSFSSFFDFFDNHIVVHNRKEERHLFPILHQRMIDSGEHSKEPIPKTAVDLMEDDHIKFIQLATLTMNLLGLAYRLPDKNSRALTLDLAYHNGIELIELLRLHIFREDKTLFPLAQKLLSPEELDLIGENLNNE